ncbi:MAG: U32 family peptidase, partial [Candidatus Adiutrix sp.]|nr:U32 family peptidase [Candidatus Adiutrix sp.]
MAPGGSKGAWAAAVEAGADAVYVGLKDFSARTYAENFTLAELAGVLGESRRAGVKIYLAVNSLVKEAEWGAAWKLLAAAAELGPDALIIQDWGLNRLAARHFPQLPRHASTLTGVHSLPGLAALKEAGFTQAVLARELAFDEVAALSLHSPIGLEVFIHGALCFSVSGLCLMSSFLGGRSALRGGCTQPCRRSYRQGRRQAALFSLADLALAPYLRELRRLPLAGLKIEGRMKGPDYVGRVVRAYRLLLDAPDEAWPEAWAEAENMLAKLPGRRTCGGPWAVRTEGPMAPLSQETTSGLKLGFMEPAGAGRGRLTLLNPLARLDRLRLQARTGEESAAFNLKTLWLDQAAVEEAPAGASVVLEAPRLPAGEGWLY